MDVWTLRHSTSRESTVRYDVLFANDYPTEEAGQHPGCQNAGETTSNHKRGIPHYTIYSSGRREFFEVV